LIYLFQFYDLPIFFKNETSLLKASDLNQLVFFLFSNDDYLLYPLVCLNVGFLCHIEN
jgi:hypothetical protein